MELGTQNPVRSFFQRVDARVGRGREIAAVLMAICDHHCAASRIARGSNILPAVAYEKALRQIDAPILGGLQQQARLGFTTLTLVGIVVEADANIAELQPEKQYRKQYNKGPKYQVHIYAVPILYPREANPPIRTTTLRWRFETM